MIKTLCGLLLLLALPALAFAHGMSAADQARILNAGYVEYIDLGARHMLTGYDHLLFLFGVVFFLTRFIDILKLVTAFTIGHSITLVFATLYGIQANYYLIDAVIALTVCCKAFDNLDGFRKYLDVQSPNLFWMVFAFGLIHGLGFAHSFEEKPLASGDFLPALFSFNLGIEFGQLAVIGIAYAVVSPWWKRDWYRAGIARPASVMIAASGLYWVVERSL